MKHRMTLVTTVAFLAAMSCMGLLAVDPGPHNPAPRLTPLSAEENTEFAGLYQIWAARERWSWSSATQLAPEPAPARLSDEQVRRFAELLRKAYPFESVRERLAYEHHRARNAARPTERPAADSPPGLLTFEDPHWEQDAFWEVRTGSLSALHSENVEKFIRSPGNGVTRMEPPSIAVVLRDHAPESVPMAPAPPAPKPAPEPPPTLVTKFVAAPSPATWMPSWTNLSILHRERGQFASVESNGYVKDVDHVAGFRPHAINSVPQMPYRTSFGGPQEGSTWKTVRMELVSLLKFAQPGVYVIDTFPDMQRIKHAEVRPLTAFEADALGRLRNKDDLVVDPGLNEVRMVGALRASERCLKCHDGQKGDLLGAFSYLLRRDPPATTPADVRVTKP